MCSNNFTADVQIPTQNIRNMENEGNTTPSKLNNSTVTESNDTEVDELSKNSKE
jgi:hypothetical protein